MNEIDWNDPTIKMIAIGVAGVVGYAVVSKLFDFFKKGSSWEDETPQTSAQEEITPEERSPVEDVDAIRKRQEQEYRDWQKNRD